jgi:hypothetical protein
VVEELFTKWYQKSSRRLKILMVGTVQAKISYRLHDILLLPRKAWDTESLQKCSSYQHSFEPRNFSLGRTTGHVNEGFKMRLEQPNNFEISSHNGIHDFKPPIDLTTRRS